MVLRFIGLPLKTIASLRTATPAHLSKVLTAQREMLGRKRLVLDRAIDAIQHLHITVEAGAVPAPQLFKRIIEVIEMNSDPELRRKDYDALVQAKMVTLKSFPPTAMADLRAEWKGLVTEIRAALGEDPKTPVAQAFAGRWTTLLGRMTGRPLDASVVAEYYRTQKWQPEMNAYVDEDVWTFMSRVFEAQRGPRL